MHGVYLLRLLPEYAAGRELQLVTEVPELPAGAVLHGAKLNGAAGLLVHKVFAIDAQRIALHLNLEVATHLETWCWPWISFSGSPEAIGKLDEVIPAWAKP
jgi:hypothetical protein